VEHAIVQALITGMDPLAVNSTLLFKFDLKDAVIFKNQRKATDHHARLVSAKTTTD
jgi:hypothetical protein